MTGTTDGGYGAGGGALFVLGAALVAEGSNFTECETGGVGGGVSVYYGSTATDVTTTIADSNFTGCSATGGGACSAPSG